LMWDRLVDPSLPGRDADLIESADINTKFPKKHDLVKRYRVSKEAERINDALYSGNLKIEFWLRLSNLSHVAEISDITIRVRFFNPKTKSHHSTDSILLRDESLNKV